MISQLRPLSLGEILDRTAQLYRSNFWRLAGVAAAPAGAIVAASAVLGAVLAAAAVTRHGIAPAAAVTGLVVGALLVVLAPLLLAAAVFSQAGLTRAALSAHNGRTLKVRDALGGVRPRFWRFLWLLVLQGSLAAGIPGVIAAAAIAILAALFRLAGGGSASPGLGFLILLIAAAAMVAAVWRALGYAMGLPACVVEEKTAWDSIQRAIKLSTGTRGRIFVMFLLVWALSLVLSMVVYIPVAIMAAIAATIGHGAQYAALALIMAESLNVMGNFMLQTLIAPVYVIALLLFYFDQRVRTEGYDIERMMDEAGLNQWAGAGAAPGLLIDDAPSEPAMCPDTVKKL